MAVILGLDIGKKRIGVAIAEEMLSVATPHETIHFSSIENLSQELNRLLREFGASKIVVGYPKNLKGEIGPAAEQVTALVERLKTKVSAEWIFWDERLSTKEAEHLLIDADVSRERRKKVIDSLAAQRILQNYMDCERMK